MDYREKVVALLRQATMANDNVSGGARPLPVVMHCPVFNGPVTINIGADLRGDDRCTEPS